MVTPIIQLNISFKSVKVWNPYIEINYKTDKVITITWHREYTGGYV